MTPVTEFDEDTGKIAKSKKKKNKSKKKKIKGTADSNVNVAEEPDKRSSKKSKKRVKLSYVWRRQLTTFIAKCGICFVLSYAQPALRKQ